MREATSFVVTLTGIGLLMAVILHADAVRNVMAAFVGLIRDVFALGNAHG
jgi:hypothetical protein